MFAQNQSREACKSPTEMVNQTVVEVGFRLVTIRSMEGNHFCSLADFGVAAQRVTFQEPDAVVG